MQEYNIIDNSKKLNFPYNIAIIMDGNGRWAQNRKLSINAGHKEGGKNLLRILKHAKNIGVKSLTLYAFSTENWKRPKAEVDFIMQMFSSYLIENGDKITEDSVNFKVIGDRNGLSKEIILKIDELEAKTQDNNSLFLNIAFNYGGRSEILYAVKNIISDVRNNIINDINIDEDLFKKYLYNPDIIYPDLIIRTGGELRISNFLLWELSYSELYFTDILWPDFNEKALDKAIEDFKKRKRTYGERKAIR